jgi:flagellin-specific chaperone FliS
LSHAALVLGRLDSWVDHENGGESAQALARFYAYLRHKMIVAAGTKSADVLDAQISMILQVRASWQQLDTAAMQAPKEQATLPPNPSAGGYRTTIADAPDRIPFSQSA